MDQQLWYIKFNTQEPPQVVGLRQSGRKSIELNAAPEYVKDFLWLRADNSPEDIDTVADLERATITGNIQQLTRKNGKLIARCLIDKPKKPIYRKPLVSIDWDTAYSVTSADEEIEQTCFFDVTKDKDGWYVSVCLDNLSYTGEILTDDGPYDDERSAVVAGFDCAVEAMVMGGEVSCFEIDSRLTEWWGIE